MNLREPLQHAPAFQRPRRPARPDDERPHPGGRTDDLQAPEHRDLDGDMLLTRDGRPRLVAQAWEPAAK